MRLHFGDENNLKEKDAVASLAGSMLTRGTEKHTRQQLSDEFDRLKAQVRVMGRPTGATVTIQTTKENFPAVLNLVGEVLRTATFPESEFETLKQQQITSIEAQRSEPQTIAMVYAERHLNPYPKSDVRYVPTLDEELEQIKSVKLDDVKSFYKNFYGASNAEFAAVGDVDAEGLQKQLTGLFGEWKSNEHYARVVSNYKDVSAINQPFETPDKANAFFVAVQPVKMDDASPDYPALTLANYMLGGGFLNSRLATRIRVKDGLSYGIGSQLSVPIQETAATFMTYAISAPQNTAKVESDFKEELKRAIDGGFTEEEITAAKSGWLQSRQVSRGQDGELATKLAGNAFWGRTLDWDANIDAKVKALTAADVNAAFRKYIDPAKISVLKAGDFAKANAGASATGGSK
jgi:zinc protease